MRCPKQLCGAALCLLPLLRWAPLRKPKHAKAPFRTWHPPISAGSTDSGDSIFSGSRGRLHRPDAALWCLVSSVSLIDQNSILSTWAATQMRMHNELVKKGHRAFSAQSRCWPGGAPGQLLFLQPFYFIQTAQEVWMIWERDHQVRRVYLNREHSENPKPSWFGESVGHYENGELVI